MATDSLRQDMVDQVREEQAQRPRMQRAPRPPATRADEGNDADAAAAPESASDDTAEGFASGEAGAPRKRRRRRRSGGGGGVAGASDAGPASQA